MTITINDTGFITDALAGMAFTPLADISDAEATEIALDLPSHVPAHEVAPCFERLSAIRIAFDHFSDGRGFGLARQLRQLGYTGHLRATGHLIADQFYHARRCGFDDVEISQELGARQPHQQWSSRANWQKTSYQDVLTIA